MDYTRQLVISLLCLGAVAGDEDFSLTDCSGNPQTELLTFPASGVSPYPIPVPGDIGVSGSLRLNRVASGDLSLDVTIERYVGFFWLTVPCISEVGSCTYRDACDILASNFGNGTSGCPPQIQDAGLPCTCPIPAGTYTMTNGVFTIPELSGLYSWLAEGDYRVTLKLIDNPTGEEIACQKLTGSIVDGHPSCSGFLCSILG